MLTGLDISAVIGMSVSNSVVDDSEVTEFSAVGSTDASVWPMDPAIPEVVGTSVDGPDVSVVAPFKVVGRSLYILVCPDTGVVILTVGVMVLGPSVTVSSSIWRLLVVSVGGPVVSTSNSVAVFIVIGGSGTVVGGPHRSSVELVVNVSKGA